MAAKIIITEKTQMTNYFELSYIFILDIPKSQRDKIAESTAVIAGTKVEPQDTGLTKEVTGRFSFGDDVSIEEIQAFFERHYAYAQEDLNNEIKLDFYGMSWDGEVWS